MADLATTYMGLSLASPLVVAASSVSNMIDRIEKVEANGAGAVVIRSLFEEQAFHDDPDFDLGSIHAAYFPTLEQSGVKDHLQWTERTRQQVKLPLIGSLNCVQPASWVRYAQALESTGVNALELNFYRVETSVERSGAEIEQELLDTVAAVHQAVKLPIAVKLSPYHTSVAHIAHQLAERGVAGLVLFNRFLQPDIQLDDLTLHSDMFLSSPEEIRLPLRWTAILYGRVQAELALNTGVHSGLDAVKAILAGAQVVQVASALLRNGLGYLETIRNELKSWMETHEYGHLDEFRGKLSQMHYPHPQTFERAQYVNLILRQH
ncbi:MAG: dihydroorotate dehydrogenase-like protein [Anaerolineae bacterium]|nr:dihydroorotate dehydrogenase-like protein [Anaerolineae bacterium]